MNKKSLLVRIYYAILFRICRRDAKLFTWFLRKIGMKIGNGIFWGPLNTISIDINRPSLIEIGDNVRINYGFTMMAHDGSNAVLRRVYHEFISSSGHIKIGNNVYFGRWCTVLKGVTIGDNCIIGYGSVVTRDIPANSVAIGRPAKVICTLDEYYQKRKTKHVEEALEYARSIKERLGRRPVISDFWEEFPLFLNGNEDVKELPIKEQYQESYDYYKKNHRPVFDGFEDFLEKAGV